MSNLSFLIGESWSNLETKRSEIFSRIFSSSPSSIESLNLIHPGSDLSTSRRWRKVVYLSTSVFPPNTRSLLPIGQEACPILAWGISPEHWSSVHWLFSKLKDQVSLNSVSPEIPPKIYIFLSIIQAVWSDLGSGLLPVVTSILSNLLVSGSKISTPLL